MNKNTHPSVPISGRIGLDIGRVIISPAFPHGRADTSFLSGGEERALRTPPSPGAFRVIRRLVEHFDGKVWLVSKCGPRIESRTRRWLDFQDFYAKTGLPPDHLRFCRERSQKRQHCTALGITHFVDDRLDVLRHLHGLVPHLYLFGHQRRRERAPDWLHTVRDWEQVEAQLLP